MRGVPAILDPAGPPPGARGCRIHAAADCPAGAVLEALLGLAAQGAEGFELAED